MVYGIVYAPDKVDPDGDRAPREVVEQMAYDFMRVQRTTMVDKGHYLDPDERFVAKSWLVRSGDTLLPLEKENA